MTGIPAGGTLEQKWAYEQAVADINKKGGIYIDKIFEHNPMMNDLHPGEKRDILEGFHVISEATAENRGATSSFFN